MQTKEHTVNCGKSTLDGIEGVDCSGEWHGEGRTVKTNVIVAQHEKQRPTQFVRLQLSLRVKVNHDILEIGAVLFELPLAKHFDKGKKLDASGADRMGGWIRGSSVAPPYKLPCRKK